MHDRSPCTSEAHCSFDRRGISESKSCCRHAPRDGGAETGLDKRLLEAIKDPLTHAVRNALDHGIEAPEARLAAGKDPEGVLKLRAVQEGSHVIKSPLRNESRFAARRLVRYFDHVDEDWTIRPEIAELCHFS